MNEKVLRDAARYKTKRRRRKAWKKVVSCLSAVVVFVTTYMLILPAITLESGTFCGLEEHVHGDSCYSRLGDSTLLCTPESLGLHVHGEGCYDENGACICGQADYVIHSHSELCYNDQGVLICTLPEMSQHVHDESCYALQGAHSHEESCFEMERGELICTLDQVLDHMHSLSCTVQQLVCTVPENHSHDENCMQDEENPCSIPEGHVHSEDCYESVLMCHSHTDDCYEWTSVNVCGLEESEGERVLVCNQPLAAEHVHSLDCFGVIGEEELSCTLAEDENHIHSDRCYGYWQLICSLEEHSHEKQCYSDRSADVETEAQWEASFADVEFSGETAGDVLAIAASQLGYRESSKNYYVTDDGLVTRGYTRYGDWYGDSYGDWCAMFASFCIHYANVVDFPIEAYCPSWIKDLEEMGLYRKASEYIPAPGDLVFFDHENDGIVDHVGLVEEVIDTDMTTIEGNSNDAVARNEYELFDNTIVGYGLLSTAKVELPREESSGTDENGDIYEYDAWAEIIEADSQAQLQEQSGFFSGLFSAFSTNGRYSAYSNRVASLDLTPYIDDVKMYDMDGNVLPSGSVVTEGDMIEFRIEYTIDGQQLGVMNGNTVSVNSNTLTYGIPQNFQVVRDSSGDIRNAAGAVVGTFTIDSETGTITMVFNDTYVEDNAKGNAIHGFISFFSVVTRITDGESEDQDYKFTDDITLGITIEENKERVGDLSVEKSVFEVVGDEIYFVLDISSTEGTSGPVTINDLLTNELEYYNGIWRMEDGEYFIDSTLVPNVAADKKSFSLTLPQLAAGETIRVGYAAKLDESLLGADLTVGNTATVESVDNQNVPLTDSATVDYTYKLLDKTHTVNADGSVSWSIKINESKIDISGWVLSDVFRTESGNVNYEGTVTVKDTNGNVLAENISLPLTFPAGSTNTYVVTYTTSADVTDQINYNTAYLRYGELEISDREAVGVGSPIVKSGQIAGEVYQDEEGTYLLPINWTITVNTYGGEMAAGEYFTDKMNGYPSGDMYVTYDQLMEIFAHFMEVISSAGGRVGWVQAAAYVPGTETGEIYDYFDLRDKVDGCDSLKYERFWVQLDQTIPEGKVFTFTYQTTGVFKDNLVTKTIYKNRFNVNEKYEVEADVEFSSGNVNVTKFAMLYYNPSESADSQDWDLDYGAQEGETQLKYERLKKNYLAWAIEVSVPPDYSGTGDITIYEDLPDGVTVKRLDMSFLEWIPGPRQTLDNLETGTTYTYDFTLYTGDQYASGNFSAGGTQASITVEVTDGGDLVITIPGGLLETQSRCAELKGADEHWSYLYVYTQINEDFQWTPTEENPYVYVDSFENRVTVRDENGTPIDISSQTQTVTRDDSEKVLRKDATVEGNIIGYAVLINGTGLDLIENSSILSIHDELTYVSSDDQFLRLRLVPGSVKLYEANVFSYGSYTLGKELEISYHYSESSTEENGVTTWVHTIDLDVPDGKAVVLVYEYSAVGDKDAVHDVANTCAISGVGQGSLTGDSKLELEVKQSTAQADIQGVIIYKVDADDDGMYLANAKFNLYIWNEEQGKYIIVHHPDNGNELFTTNASGQITLDKTTVDPNQFAYNTAYYIVEIESPEGYYLGPEPYYFYIYNENTSDFPYCMPDGFTGDRLVNGDIIYRQNTSDTTEITIEKYWQHFNESPIDVSADQVGEVKIELWREIHGNPQSKELYGTYTIVPDENGDWILTIKDLPRATRNADGTKGTDYLYYVKEVDVDGYELVDAENNAGINSGIIKLTNRQQAGYELPTTGGAGTAPYIIGGLLLCTVAVILLCYNFKPRRKEEPTSS